MTTVAKDSMLQAAQSYHNTLPTSPMVSVSLSHQTMVPSKEDTTFQTTTTKVQPTPSISLATVAVATGTSSSPQITVVNHVPSSHMENITLERKGTLHFTPQTSNTPAQSSSYAVAMVTDSMADGTSMAHSGSVGSTLYSGLIPASPRSNSKSPSRSMLTTLLLMTSYFISSSSAAISGQPSTSMMTSAAPATVTQLPNFQTTWTYVPTQLSTKMDDTSPISSTGTIFPSTSALSLSSTVSVDQDTILTSADVTSKSHDSPRAIAPSTSMLTHSRQYEQSALSSNTRIEASSASTILKESGRPHSSGFPSISSYVLMPSVFSSIYDYHTSISQTLTAAATPSGMTSSSGKTINSQWSTSEDAGTFLPAVTPGGFITATGSSSATKSSSVPATAFSTFLITSGSLISISPSSQSLLDSSFQNAFSVIGSEVQSQVPQVTSVDSLSFTPAASASNTMVKSTQLNVSVTLDAVPTISGTMIPSIFFGTSISTVPLDASLAPPVSETAVPGFNSTSLASATVLPSLSASTLIRQPIPTTLSPSPSGTESVLPSSGRTPLVLPSSERIDSVLPSSERTDSVLLASDTTPVVLPSSERIDSVLPSSGRTDSVLLASEGTISVLPSSGSTPLVLPSSERIDSVLPSSDRTASVLPSTGASSTLSTSDMAFSSKLVIATEISSVFASQERTDSLSASSTWQNGSIQTRIASTFLSGSNEFPASSAAPSSSVPSGGSISTLQTEIALTPSSTFLDHAGSTVAPSMSSIRTAPPISHSSIHPSSTVTPGMTSSPAPFNMSTTAVPPGSQGFQWTPGVIAGIVVGSVAFILIICEHFLCFLLHLNPSNAEAHLYTFIQSTKMLRFLKTILTLSCCYSLDSYR